MIPCVLFYGFNDQEPWSDEAVITEYHRLRGSNQHLSLTVLAAGKSKIRVLGWSYSSWQCSSVLPALMTVTFLYPHMAWKGTSGLSSSYKNTNPIMRGMFLVTPSKSNYSQNSYFQIPPPWGLELPHLNFGGDTNIQAIPLKEANTRRAVPLYQSSRLWL